MKLKIATCQFPVTADLKKNKATIIRQMKQATDQGADIAHFSETCLSGYAGVAFDSLKSFDWDLHRKCMEEILAAAAKYRIWAVVGTNHPLKGKHRPHNSLYIINSRGKLVDRYDKMFCTDGDLKHYSPGDHFCVFKVKGVTCGALICYDFRFQELYREYYKRGVQVMFHSYHNGGKSRDLAKYNIWGVIVPPTMQAYAANNHLWVSANNTSKRASCWPSFFIRPDGMITGRLTLNRAGVLVSSVDTKKKFYDASGPWRDRSLKGIYHSGALVKDSRSEDRTIL